MKTPKTTSEAPANGVRRPADPALPMQTRLAAVQPATLNADDRTVELVWSTGARVARRDWWTGKRFDEELSLDAGHCDLARLNGGAPLLNTHGQWDLSGVIGVVERAWIDKGEGRALVRFSAREDVDPFFRDVTAGIIRNVSVGYVVRKFEITEEEGKVPVYRAVDWEPTELSMVPVGADASAGTRARPNDPTTFPCEFVNRAPAHITETPMKKENQTEAGGAPADETTRTPPPAPAPANADPAPAQPSAADAAAGERKRVLDIQAAGRALNVDQTAVDKAVADGTSVDAARALFIDAVAARAQPGPTQPHVTFPLGGQEETDTRRSLMQNALLHRYQPGQFKLEDGARQYRGLSLIEMAKEALEANGVKTRGLVPAQVSQLALNMDRAGGMMSTSDFPLILANTANKVLRAAYEMSPGVYQRFCRRATARDFKPMTRLQFGEAPELKKVVEGGEIKHGTIGEGKETYALATYARIVAITRQTIINDDLDAFTRVPSMYGQAAADLESDTVMGLITANASMGDNVALFHAATHGNLAGSGAVISVASVGAGRAAMRKQKALDGKIRISVRPKFLLVPAAIETAAEQFVHTVIVAVTDATANPFKGTLEVLADPRLDDNSATAWYLIADPMQIDTIEYAYLEGQEGVFIESRLGWEVDGLEIKARLDFGAKPIDWRGMYKNPGAAP